MTGSRDGMAPAAEAGGQKPDIVVFVHVHYPDVWADLARLLVERMPVAFRLVITSSLPPADIVLPETPLLSGVGIIAAENRGRDIRPFLAAFAETRGYSLALKLHTKRSDHRLDGTAWRDDLVGSLLPSREGVSRLLAAFEADAGIGLAAPDGALLPLEPWILRNMKGMRRAAAALGMPFDQAEIDLASFIAGSMFWFRPAALGGMGTPALQDLFEPERGQVDGTIAHALERLIGLNALQKGFRLVPAGALTGLGNGAAEAMSGANDSRFLIPQPRFVQLLHRYLPFVRTLYRSLPVPLRRRLRRLTTGR